MKGLNKELELSLKREIYSQSYYEFFKFCFTILFPSEKYEDSLHVGYLCNYLQAEVERMLRREEKDKDIIINLPPRASKSLIANVCLTSWVWIRDPSITFIVVSFDEKLSLVNAQYSRDIIKSLAFQELFGDIFQIRKDADAKGLFYTNKGGYRLSTTTGASVVGLKGQIIITDDIQSPKTAESILEIEKVNDYYSKTLYNRLTPINLGFRVNIQQRLNVADVTGTLLEKHRDDYHHICLPAEVSDNVNPPELKSLYINGVLDPNRLSPKILKQFRQVLGERGYAGQYSQLPAPETGNIIQEAWFDIISPYSITRDSINEPIYFFLDSAYTKKTENDPSAILACFRKNNILYIIDSTEVWLELPELIKFVKEYVVKNMYTSNSKIFVEPKASGLSLVQSLRAETMLNVVEAPNPDTDKTSRVHAITPILESRRVRLLDGSYIPSFIEQLKVFPNGVHDDRVDTLSMAVKEMLVEGASPDFFFL